MASELDNENVTQRSQKKKQMESVDEQEETFEDTISTKQNIKSNMGFSTIDNFDGKNWDAFEQQLECYVLLNEVPEEKKVPLLLTKITRQVFETLTNLCIPKKPATYTFKDLCAKLNQKYEPKQATILDRAHFRNRNQLPSETIEEYLSDLRKLSQKCNFKDWEDQIKEKFIDGVQSKVVRFELLKTGSEMNLDQVVLLARTVEAALKQSNQHETSASEIYKTEFKSLKNKTKYQSNKNKEEGNKVKYCYCCGNNNHLKKDCTLATKYCSECGQQGHIFKVCRKNPRFQRSYLVEEEKETNPQPKKEQEEDVEEAVVNLFSVSRVPPHYITLNIEGKSLDFLLDTGSDVTVIPQRIHSKFFQNIKIHKSNVQFRNFDQSLSKPIGLLKAVKVGFNEKKKTLCLFVAHDDVPLILGRDWLKTLDLWPPKLYETNVIAKDRSNNIKNVSEAEYVIKEKFSEVFSSKFGKLEGEEIKLKLKPEAKPKVLPVRRVPYALKDKVKLEITRLLQNGRITPVEHSQWGTPVVPIQKPDGSIRLCGDYKLTLNPYLEVDHFPLPHIEEILDTLKNGEYFCELDLKEAYLQACLDKESQEMTTIVTEIGTYNYKYLPYGVSTGPGSFQRLMANRLANIPKTIVFIDNIYIAGNNLNDTFNILCEVLKRLQSCQFRLKLNKCHLFKKHIDVFGYRITKQEVSVIQSNIKPLVEAKPPKDITMLRSFLGKINYYARFLKDMATIMAPLYECTKQNKLNWTSDCENAFNKIKQKLASVDNLRHFNPELPLILSCDASDTGLGAVLSNRDKNGVIKPIAYASKKLNSVEQKYSTIDKEAMSIIFGVTKFYNYTYGRSFELETDNAALVRIFGPNKGIPKMAAKRLQHYAIFLSAFNYKIRHVKSSLNPADFLSRSCMDVKNNDNISQNSLCINANESQTSYLDNSNIKKLDWKVIQNETSKDPSLVKVIRYSMDGWPEKKLIDKELSTYYNRKNEISIDRNCLFWGFRIIIPTTLKEAILEELHKSHFGIVKMKQLARSYFWWPNIDRDIENVTKSCLPCLQNHKSPPKIPLKPWPIPPGAWYRLHADFLGPFHNKMYMVIVDAYSKWPEAFEMSSIGAEKTIDVFKNLFCRFGFPVRLVTDNGPTFTSLDFKNYCEKSNIKHTFSPPYHPATNGAAERFVETFKTHVTKIKESGYNLKSAVNLFLFDYRSLPHSTSGVTPAKLMLGRELRNRFSLMRPSPIADHSYEMTEKQKQNALGNRDLEFTVGEKVMVRDYRKGCKPWTVGIIIDESIPGVTFNIDVEGKNWKRHVNQMLKCNSCLLE